jgi:hypothetical protein
VDLLDELEVGGDSRPELELELDHAQPPLLNTASTRYVVKAFMRKRPGARDKEKARRCPFER